MKALVFVLVLFFSPSTNAQNLQFGLRLGTAIPTGDFGNKDLNVEEAGAAKLGYYLGLHGDYFFTENFGASATILHGSNALDDSEFALAQQQGINVDLSPYKFTGFFIGGLAQAHIDVVDVQLKLSPGLISSKSFGMDISDGVTGFTVDPDNSFQIGLLTEIGAIYKFQEQLGVGINLGYLAFTSKFEFDIESNIGVSFSDLDGDVKTNILLFGILAQYSF